MKQGRWDIVLVVRSGPTASPQPLVFRGPTVAVGTDPGPGGVRLPPGRGVAREHCTIAVYDPTSVWVTPTGHNPVRIAPYAAVRWEDIEVVQGRVRLERGCAVHLGPTGQRGVTLELVECRDLGIQEVERLVAQAEDAALVVDDERAPVVRPPDAYEARGTVPGVRTLLADVVDPAVLGLVLAVMGTASLVLLAVVGVKLLAQRAGGAADEVPALELVELVFPETTPVVPGFEGAWEAFVMRPSREWASVAGVDLGAAPVDEELRRAVQQYATNPVFARSVARVVEQRADAYLGVLDQLLAHDPPMPAVLAAIPIQESNYNPLIGASPTCALGAWQIMPEWGFRFASLPGFGAAYEVADCAWRSAPGVPAWSPTAPVPPRNVKARAPYVEADPRAKAGTSCRIHKCAKDFRQDMTLSTRAAIYTFRESLTQPEVAASGQVVPIAVAAHNAGLDDERIGGVYKSTNLVNAWRRWRGLHPQEAVDEGFLGKNLVCTKGQAEDACAGLLPAETQRYVVSVLGQHFIAVCHLARTRPARVPEAWSSYLSGYCREVPALSGAEGQR